MFTRRKFVSAPVALAAAVAVALSGCSGGFVDIVDPNGYGVCGSDAVSLVVTQSAGGNFVNIEYQGPADVSLVAYQGPYSDSRFFGDFPTESFIFGYPFSDTEASDVALNAIPEHLWDVTSAGAGIEATYNGPVSEFVAALEFTEEGGDAILPVTVAVLCELGFESMVIPVTFDSNGVISQEISFAVAQAFYPNFLYASAPTVTEPVLLANGVSGQMTLPPEISDSASEDFEPTVLTGTAVYIGPGDPMAPPTEDNPFTLDGATLGDIWMVTMFVGVLNEGNSLNLEITGDMSLTEPNDFTLTTNSESDLPHDGYYMMTMIIAEPEGEGFGDLRMVASVMRFDAENGLSFEALNEAPESEGLADTGGDPNVVIWAVLGGLVLLAAVFLRSKRRKAQDGATIDPSARKE